MTTAATPARIRADRYAAQAPEGATVTVTEETRYGTTIAQCSVSGNHETVCVTVSSREGSGRTRCHATHWYRWGGVRTPVKVGSIVQQIRSIYVNAPKEVTE